MYEKRIRRLLANQPEKYRIEELRGLILGCSCKPGECHGDVLVKMYKELVSDVAESAAPGCGKWPCGTQPPGNESDPHDLIDDSSSDSDDSSSGFEDLHDSSDSDSEEKSLPGCETTKTA